MAIKNTQTRKRSLTEFAGILSSKSADRLEEAIRASRAATNKRLKRIREELKP